MTAAWPKTSRGPAMPTSTSCPSGDIDTNFAYPLRMTYTNRAASPCRVMISPRLAVASAACAMQ
jgi:hypothetical protein